MAVGVVNALLQHEFHIPDDISIVSSDGYALGKLVYPPLTSVAHPIDDLIDLTLSRLVLLITKTKVQSPQQTLLQPYIVERESVKLLKP